MKKMFFTVALLAAAFAVNVNAGGASRYWDGCKPSCSWSTKQQFLPGKICKECDRNNNQIIPTSDQNSSSCQGGPAYTCWDMIPFADPSDANRAYAYAASPTDQCGKCFELTFDGGFQHGAAYATHRAIAGKVLTVMTSNMGGDVGQGQFDILIPGGGLGQFDSFSGQLGVSKDRLGANEGGFLADCERTLNWASGTLAQYQKCLRDKCNDVFSDPKHALLKQGCNFYADWFMAANNPTMSYKEVACPQILIDRYTTGGNTPTPGPAYTLTINRNPADGGATDPTGAQSGISAGTPVGITATAAAGYAFNNWTISGSGAIAKADDASTTVTVNGNVTVTANFKQNSSVRNAASAKARGGVTLKPAPGGFTALLPAIHGYTSYKVINVQGREIKNGKIGADANNLSVSGLTRGVFFLRLEGKDKAPTPSLKVVTY